VIDEAEGVYNDLVANVEDEEFKKIFGGIVLMDLLQRFAKAGRQ
jgi:hypothetical protein